MLSISPFFCLNKQYNTNRIPVKISFKMKKNVNLLLCVNKQNFVNSVKILPCKESLVPSLKVPSEHRSPQRSFLSDILI